MKSKDVFEQEWLRGKAGEAWGGVIWWIGIYLTRMALGAVLGIVLSVLTWNVVTKLTGQEIVTLGDAPGLLLTLVVSLPLVALLSVIFLPFGQVKKKFAVRGEIAAIAAVLKLLPPAIILQVVAAASGNAWLTFVNFLLASGVVFLVTLALDISRARQFPLLVLGALHGISLIAASLILDPGTPVDGIEFKVVSWIGALPPLILMGLLLVLCARRLRGRGEPPRGHSGSERHASPSHEAAIGGEQTTGLVVETNEGGERFFYVGPGNDPVGPISADVLLQLRRSGTVSDHTFVAREGESDWEMLGDCIVELESSTTR